MNYGLAVWQCKAHDYSIVQCAMLYGLEPGLQRHFERHGALKEICPRGNNNLIILFSLYHDKCLLFMQNCINRKLDTCVDT